ncbi:hypothetical protein TPSD3_06225 [Thioflexithrix psekupsensis]|uniref:Protein kinase domain-containing protein n=2 Tax=Thioflexithrix psekupsensis TaxID=1570016 RepID=A0A251X7G5_9GAMM|nr:hypothetical protein TPSD3_06225 [Thioflexithrix psekupsensis]
MSHPPQENPQENHTVASPALHRHALPHGFWLNEYQIESVLGNPGGFGITYLATDTHLQQRVAIKEYLPSEFAVREGISTVQMRSDSDAPSFRWGLERFVAEARALARFHHPNVVRVLRYFEANGTAYMVMEYQNGENLSHYIKRKGTLTEEEFLAILLPLLDGLEKVHEAGLLHRDIKPNNIYIRSDNSPVLLDFGSARYSMNQERSIVTSIVTPGYAPLEQYDNEREAQGPWTDIYALGAVSYFMVNGEPPMPATRRVIKDPLIPAKEIGEGRYSTQILAAIDWALQPTEEKRPQSIAEWRAALLADRPSYRLSSLAHAASPAKNGNRNKAFGKSEHPLVQRWLTSSLVLFILALMMSGITLFLYLDEKWKTEHQLRLSYENELATLRTQFAQLDAEKKRVDEMLNLLMRFSDQALALDKEKFKKEQGEAHFIKYYKVDNVAPGDVLNIRHYPGDLGSFAGKIPRDADCIRYLDRSHFVFNARGPQLWVMINYEGTVGWVHSRFLMQNFDCQSPSNEAQIQP